MTTLSTSGRPGKSAPTAGSRRGLGGVFRRLLSSNTELVNAELADQAAKSGCSRLSECRARSRVMIQGLLVAMTLNPHGERRWLEAELSDGTGQVTLVWMGRHSIPGIEAGKSIRVWGRLTKDRGRQVIFNPEYELLD